MLSAKETLLYLDSRHHNSAYTVLVLPCEGKKESTKKEDDVVVVSRVVVIKVQVRISPNTFCYELHDYIFTFIISACFTEISAV